MFVDGRFWDGCPEHGMTPATNAEYWIPKLEENKRRDARNTAALEAAGWPVVRAWTHEPPEAIADRVQEAVGFRTDAETRATDRARSRSLPPVDGLQQIVGLVPTFST